MISIKTSNAWKTISNSYVKVSNVWKTVGNIYVKVNGTWRAVWSYKWNTGAWGQCSASCGGGTQTRSVTCQRNDGRTVSDSFCNKYVGNKPATNQPCNTQTCAECKFNLDIFYPLTYWATSANPPKTGLMWESQDIYYVSAYYPNMTSYTSNGYLYTRGYLDMNESGIFWYAICRSSL